MNKTSKKSPSKPPKSLSVKPAKGGSVRGGVTAKQTTKSPSMSEFTISKVVDKSS